MLALAPIRWLVITWFDPSYQSSGSIYLLAIIGLVVWSATSRLNDKACHNHKAAILLLVISALIRVASQILAINIIGGIALALDIFAILTLFNFSSRVRPISAFWVSILFLFTLPFERVLQRLLGYPMQELSASGTCQLLGTYYSDLTCNGVRIQVAAQDVLVDLPCSGTTSLMLSAAFLVCLNAIYRPRFSTALLWGIITICLSILGNILRITMLAVGLVNKELIFGVDVMAQPVHDLIGYTTIVLSLLPLVLFYKPQAAPQNNWGHSLQTKSFQIPIWVQRSSALGFVALVFVVITLPARPLDISTPVAPIEMPSNLLGHKGITQPLEPIEKDYFEQFGGRAQKARFGPMALTLVQTSSPLRHLHSPEDCLRGLGYEVTFLGTRFEPTPTAIYRATGPKGDQWNVAVTFTASSGFATSNVAEAIWHWLKNPGSRWSSIQRITPWIMPNNERQNLEAAVISALDITPTINSPKGDTL